MSTFELSPARRLAHAECTRLNLERFEREKEDGLPRNNDTVTFRLCAYRPGSQWRIKL